ncbi:unnamed protein product [Symbiodinium sp. CCMP2592]|nr:unnamed protein product [Symbiodinium sp. CCMP2592]
MAFSAHAGTSTSIPGSVIFDEGHSFSIIPAPTPTPKLGRRRRAKQHEKGQERFPELDDEVYEVDDEMMAGHTRRERVKMKALNHISAWLRYYSFEEMDVNELQVPSGCFLFRPESMCAIHVAAKLGHDVIIKTLLIARADPKRKTSRGRTALQIAQKADVDGSHREALEALETADRTMSLRRAIELMSNSAHACSGNPC